MAGQLSGSSDFAETLAIHVALKAAIKTGKYAKNPALKRAALNLRESLESDKSIFGKQLKMLKLMETGASVPELGRRLRTSRRTLFRYLNYLEDAGIEIELTDGRYRVGRSLAALLRG